MLLRYFQKGFNYSQDGPGNRLVYHMQGCNMHCPWCSNPEGMNIDDICTEKSIDEIIAEIISCKPMFFDGGGVTFTGGEASMQLEAVFAIMKILKESGISTAIETNATNPYLPKLCGVCDCFMIDFKHPDAKKLFEITGGKLDIIKENIKTISEENHIHIRIPLIHGFNDDDTALKQFADFFAELKISDKKYDIELLAYHEYGKEKWDKCKKAYTVKDAFVSKETLQKFKTTFKENGFTVINT